MQSCCIPVDQKDNSFSVNMSGNEKKRLALPNTMVVRKSLVASMYAYEHFYSSFFEPHNCTDT